MKMITANASLANTVHLIESNWTVLSRLVWNSYLANKPILLHTLIWVWKRFFSCISFGMDAQERFPKKLEHFL